MVSHVSGGSLSPQVLKLLGMGNGRGVSNSVAALASGNRQTSASVDVSSMSAATSLQAEITSLKNAGQNVARAESLLQVAGNGMAEVGGVLERMGELAALSNNGTLSEGGREAMNQEFQALKAEIDRIVDATEFDDQKLLDGSYDDDMLDSDFSIDDVSASALLPEEMDILSAENAAEAYGAIKDAYDKVTSQRAEIGSYQQRMDITAASIDTALQNQEAARAALADTDIAAESTDGVMGLIKYQGGIATQAQGNKLQSNLMQLLSGS